VDESTASRTPGDRTPVNGLPGADVEGGGSLASAFADGARPDEVRATARLLVDVVHAVATPQAGAETARGAVHGAGGDRWRPSPQAVRAAVSIYEHDRLTIGGLASAIGVSVGWASRIVEELEERAYVVRDRDPEDRRVVWVHLSPGAIADVEGAYRWRDDAVARALDGMGPDERRAVRAFLGALVGELTPEAAAGAGEERTDRTS
jgi:DNA-binding MarR family transcriptional regulator